MNALWQSNGEEMKRGDRLKKKKNDSTTTTVGGKNKQRMSTSMGERELGNGIHSKCHP